MPQWMDFGYLSWREPKRRDGMFDAGEPVSSLLREFPVPRHPFGTGMHPHGDARIALEPVRPLLAEAPAPPIRMESTAPTPARLDGKIVSDPLPPVLTLPPWWK